MLRVLPFAGLLFLTAHTAAQEPLREAARLDAEGRCDEAEGYYQKALAADPSSTAILNNVGNHYLVCGQPEKARTYFERLISVHPAHPNANLQLARMAADQKQGAKALQYLARVKDSGPPVRALRAEALHWAGKRAESLATLDALEKEAKGDARFLFLMGLTYARIALYGRAEEAFQAVLALHPGEFDVLFNLGKAAARAGHYERALRALEVAVRVRPGDVDALLELGRAHAARQDYSRAVYVLAQARQRSPDRPDVLLALARAAEDAGFYGDAALAYDEYLRQRPNDDSARRDRARVYGHTGTRLQEGLQELAWYLKKHPDDPVAYFALAQFSWEKEPEKALEQLSSAVRLDPDFVAARYARAWLLNRLGRTSEALPDLQAAVRVAPRSVRALDQLGLAYLTLDRPSEAEKRLREAFAIAPKDPQVLLHLGRALMALSREEEAQRFLAEFRKVRPDKSRDPRKEPGMIELATLSQNERLQRQIERLRKDARDHPSDPELQLALASLLLTDGRTEEAAAEFRELLTRNAESRIWEQAGKSLVRAGQYPLAKEFLGRATSGTAGARLDLAIAVFFTDGPQQALRLIDQAPEAGQEGDYLLMKARMLDAAGRSAEADEALQQGLRHATSRPEVAQQAALLLLRRDRKREALDLTAQALRSTPDDPELLLMQAVVLGMMDQAAAAEKALRAIQSRWPEWDRAYVAHGLLIETARPGEARRRLQIAVSLGFGEPAARCALARISGSPSGDPNCACLRGLRGWVLPQCGTN